MPPAHAWDPNDAFIRPIVPSLKLGAVSGFTGFLLGGAVGTLRSAHPALAAAYTGTQCFVLGSSFLYTREALLQSVFVERDDRARLISSTAAGALSGAAAGAFWGRTNSIAGAVVFGTFGHLGQRYIHAQADKPTKPRDRRSYFERLADLKWIPFKSIPNVEYQIMLSEKLLKVEAEISMIDEKISNLRHSGGNEKGASSV